MSSRAGPGSKGIQVVRETIVVVEDGHYQIHNERGRSITTIESGGLEHHPRRESQRWSFRDSVAYNAINDFLRPETDEHLPRRRNTIAGGGDTLLDLIDFLRNTSPPPETPSWSDGNVNKNNKKRLFWLFWKKPGKRLGLTEAASRLVKLCKTRQW